MFRLDEFRYDSGIDAAEVYVHVDGTLEPMSRDDAIDLAHRQGANLVANWPGDDDRPSCVITLVTEPIRWEQARFDPAVASDIDENLWFTGPCGARDFLLPENAHTFNGRMSAWCPSKQVGYSVSLSEIDEMSDASRYFIKGFLTGDGPAPPYDDEGDIDPGDLRAWHAAIARFNRTGQWYGRWAPAGFAARCYSLALRVSGARNTLVTYPTRWTKARRRTMPET